MPGLYPTAYRATFPCVFMRLALVCFYCLCVFVYVFYFIATMSVAGYFLSVLFCLLSMLISDSRFDLVWFRLSCDHGWIRSGSVNVRKQQQQPVLIFTGYQNKKGNKKVVFTGRLQGGVCSLYSIGESVQCIHSLLYVLDNVTNNTSPRTAACRSIAYVAYLLTTLA